MNKQIIKKTPNAKIYIIAVIFFVLTLIFLSFDNSILNINVKNKQVINMILTISLINYSIASISSFYYYKLKKNNDIIFYLIYFLIAILVNLFFLNPIKKIDIRYEFLYLCPINRLILTMSVLPIFKLDNMTSKKKKVFIMSTLLFFTGFYFLEIIFYDINSLNLSVIILFLLLYGCFVLIYASFYNFAKFNKTNNYLYLLLSLVLVIILVRDIYILMLFLGKRSINEYSSLVIILKHIIISVYCIGLFYISSLNINHKLKNIKQLDTFYNILDESSDKEIYFLLNNKELIFANRNARNAFGINENNANYFEKVSKACCKFSETLDQNKKDTIIKALNEKNNWLGLIPTENGTEKVVEITEYINEEYGKITAILVNSNKKLVSLNKELEYKNNFYEILTKKTGDLVGIIDKEYNLTYVNDEVYKVLGYENGELIGIKIGDLFADAENSDFDVTNKQAFELHLLCKNGNIVDVETLVTPNEDGWVLSSRDITYKREMELLKKENESIKLHQELKSNFFANLSHELKTPLNIFSSIIQILDANLNKEGDDFKNLYIKHNKGLKNNIFRMIRMIRNLIDLTKFDLNFAYVNFKNYDIVNLCELITLSIVPYAEQKDINIVFDTEEEEHVIKCDGEFVERIMLNLLSNSIKYTELYGEIFVNLSFDQDYLFISVKDNGIGIPKQKQNSIFEKFVRVDKSFTRQNEGSGLGLSIVKYLVDLMEGDITVKSQEEIGSEFTVKLPNKKLDEETNIYTLDEQNINLEFSDIYEVL